MDLFCVGYSDILNKPTAIVYSLCFKKQTLELLLYLFFKAELPPNSLQDIYFKNYPDMKKQLRGHRAIFSCLGLTFPQFPHYIKVFVNLYSQVIGLTNYELRISDNQL